MKAPRLREELLALVAADVRQAEALFTVVNRDEELSAELDRLLTSPATPLLRVLPAWPARPVEGTRLIAVTRANAARLETLVDEGGWPGLSAVGADGADAAWLVAQHADLDNELRRGWLGLLADAVARGEADPRHLACLVDRIAVVDDLPQTYGTVAVLQDTNLAFPHPVAEPLELDARREAIGLPPADTDAALLQLGEIVPFGRDRHDHPLMRWPPVTA